jgi:hypothetical protein
MGSLPASRTLSTSINVVDGGGELREWAAGHLDAWQSLLFQQLPGHGGSLETPSTLGEPRPFMITLQLMDRNFPECSTAVGTESEYSTPRKAGGTYCWLNGTVFAVGAVQQERDALNFNFRPRKQSFNASL